MKKLCSFLIFVSALTIGNSIHSSSNITPESIGNEINDNHEQLTQSNWEESILFDTEFLNRYDQVTKYLKENGFEEGFFKTSDKYNINYLFLERPSAEFTVILCAGWIPGRKEGIATFFALLPKSCNILLFDARGHGKSDGRLFLNTWIYGQNEYKDVLGAIEFIHETTQKPIIIYGTCAGAFHATHALLALHKKNKLEKYQIKGFIFDSGWASLLTISWTVSSAKVKESVARFWSKIYGKKWRDIIDTIPFRITHYLTNRCLAFIHTFFFLPAFAIQEPNTNLFKRIEQLPIPILYIHSHDDEYAPISHAEYLAKKSQNARTWWIDKPSKHACHCLKHKHEYREQLHQFLAELSFDDGL